MNKNAYEIRLDVLSMAHTDVLSKYHQTLDSHRRNADKADAEFDVTLINSLYPKTSDILDRAEELYAFVSQN
jgi:hypothetical protein